MHNHFNTSTGGIIGMGALMDPGFLRDATHFENQSDTGSASGLTVWTMAAVGRAFAWLGALAHRVG